MRALAEAAALTSTSLRERWSEPGDEAKAGFLVEGTALAVGREETQEFLTTWHAEEFLLQFANASGRKYSTFPLPRQLHSFMNFCLRYVTLNW